LGRHHHYRAYAGEDAGAIIRIMPQIHDGMWNTCAPHHSYAALLKVRVLAPSSGLCFKFMTGCGIQALLITIMQHF
jgi:hypothetical protein